MSKNILLLLGAVLILGFILRVMYLPSGAVNFMYDQARDFYTVKQILSGDFKIQGPPSSLQGLNHGVFYYYLIAPVLQLSSGSPVVVSYWLAFINTLGGIIVFLLARALTRKDLTALIATFLYAVSFETTQYGVWLSNPGMAVVTVPLIYLGLWIWVNGNKKWGPVICALGLGLSIQSQIFLVYHLIPIALVLLTCRKELEKSGFLKFGGILLLALSTMILSEMKFGFQTTKGLFGIFAGWGGGINDRNTLESFFLYASLYIKSISQSLFQKNIELSGAITLAAVMSSLLTLKQKRLTPELFALIYFLSFLPVFTKTAENIPHLFVGLSPSVFILIAMGFSRINNKFKIAALGFLILIAYSNVSAILKENKKGQTLLATQKSMTIGNQRDLIDKTYEKREPFSINNVTAPLYINITWTYLYKWYGEPKYGYLPTYAGKGQDGQVDQLPQSGDIKATHFLIIEPLWGIPRRYKDEIMTEEELRSSLNEEVEYGELVLQKRKKL